MICSRRVASGGALVGERSKRITDADYGEERLKRVAGQGDGDRGDLMVHEGLSLASRVFTKRARNPA